MPDVAVVHLDAEPSVSRAADEQGDAVLDLRAVDGILHALEGGEVEERARDEDTEREPPLGVEFHHAVEDLVRGVGQ